MTLRPITKKQFVRWMVVFTIGMVLWAWPGELLWPLGVGIMGFGNLILMSSQERSRPVPRREILWMTLTLFALVLLVLASKWWLPHDFGELLARVIRHPALAAPVWAFVSWLAYRQYKASKPEIENASLRQA